MVTRGVRDRWLGSRLRDYPPGCPSVCCCGGGGVIHQDRPAPIRWYLDTLRHAAPPARVWPPPEAVSQDARCRRFSRPQREAAAAAAALSSSRVVRSPAGRCASRPRTHHHPATPRPDLLRAVAAGRRWPRPVGRPRGGAPAAASPAATGCRRALAESDKRAHSQARLG